MGYIKTGGIGDTPTEKIQLVGSQPGPPRTAVDLDSTNMDFNPGGDDLPPAMQKHLEL